MKVSFPLPSTPPPDFDASPGSCRTSKLLKMYAHASVLSHPTRVHEPGWAGSQLENTFHSSCSGTPLRSGDWSGRPPVGEARLLRGPDACQSPRAVKTSLPSLSQQSGVEVAAAAAALPGAAAPRSLGRWPVPRAAVAGLQPFSGRARPGLCGRPARRPVPFVWRRAGVCITFRTPPSPCRLSSLLLTSSPPSPPPLHPPRTASLLDQSPRTSLLERCLLSRKLPPPPPPQPGGETKSGRAASRCKSAPVPSGCTSLPGVPPPHGEPEPRSAMAEGAASREGSAPPDAAGSEDDPRVGPDATSGDCVAAAPGGRWRDRRSGVALPGAAGPPADSEAALLEAARATPRRSSIIKVSEAARPRKLGCGWAVGGSWGWGRMYGVRRHRRLSIVFSSVLHYQTFLPCPEVPRLSSWL